MHTHSLVLSALSTYAPIAYIVMAIGAAIEGEIFVFSASFLAHGGILDPFITFPVLYGSVIGGDALWYKVGEHVAKSPASRFSRLVNRLEPYVDRHLHKRFGKTIFLTKFMYFVHHPVLMRAGTLKIGLKRLIRVDLWASLVWMAIVSGIAFLAGAWLPFLRHSLRFTEVALTVGLLFFLFVELIMRQIFTHVLPLDGRSKEQNNPTEKN
jgi:membrane protein DedA with SNARE-associated domain